MEWMDKVCKEMSKLASNDIEWKNFPKWLKFKLRLMHFIWDWLTWDAVKSGWKTPRVQLKLWWFYKKHPYLKK